uniref:Leucoanthocyanidin dioxygenase n=1 Tax=Zea mays TaxID=4577 RepID=B6SI41_MAIZE|nr:leucoanthocyanidin dioxygenase [Zea mays]BBO36732.1 Fe(II)/2-oxoglutarate dependent dioxygenase [synthetic construct]
MAVESWTVPTPVKDLAALVDEPPSRFVQREEHRPGSLMLAADMPDPLPIVDLNKLSTADEAAKLRSALQTWGLFLATNHGIDASLMEDLMEASREFFHQPLQERQKYSNLREGTRFQLEGYGSDPVVAQDHILDWNDRLQLKVEPEDERSLAQWPKYPESFRDLLHEYASKTKSMRDRILRAMAKILELDEEEFIKQLGASPQAYARFNYYPPCPRPELVLGIKAHSDGPVLTVLLVDREVGGLQVQRENTWFNVPFVPHTLVINLGDSLEIMSNGIFKSPVHRVVTNAEKERISLAMLYAVERDNVLQPAAGLLDEKRPARYRRITEADFLEGVKEHFSKGIRMIETLKI